MRVLGLIFSLLSFAVYSKTILISQIEDIDYGLTSEDEILVLLKSGDVAKLRESNEILNDQFMQSKAKYQWFKICLDDDRFIIDIERTENPITEKEVKEKKINLAPMSYIPTTIASMSIAKRYQREARYNSKDSQCFNRAMVWAYEWWRKHSLKSNKILIFFTRSYIRKYNFEWWFHIAPYVHIWDEGKVVERVIDVKYTNRPHTFQDWANKFLRNDSPCPMILKYSEFADYPYTGDCFLQRTHMYTYQPSDLQMYEAWGYQKNNFNMGEVRAAYLEAFDEKI